MQGLAMEIESESPAFDPEVATLFDFLLDSPQFDLMYVLPYHRRDRAWYYRSTDGSTARVFLRTPKLAQELMFPMFTPDAGDLVLAFLDERNSLEDNRRLFQAIPVPTLRRFLWQRARTALPGQRAVPRPATGSPTVSPILPATVSS